MSLGLGLLPEAFVEKMRSLMGSEAEVLFETLLKGVKISGLRINPLKTEAQDLINMLNIPLSPVPWCKTGFTYPSDIEDARRPSKSPLYQAGLYYLQEPSAMAPVAVLNPLPGERVLDLCAAPGGKSVQIAGHLQGQGILVSNDTSATRCRALVKNLTLCGATNAVVTTELPQRLAQRFTNYFDKILIDAPCSGEGMFRKDSDAVKAWTSNKPTDCVAIQATILRDAAKMLKPGGRMIYSTCTFNPEENEGSIASFLKNHQDFHVVPIDNEAKGFASGHPGWINAPEELHGASRLWPHRLNGEGHFLCMLERKNDFIEQPSIINKSKQHNNQFYEEFCRDYLQNFKLDGFQLVTHTSKRGDGLLFAVYNDLPDLSGLRVARSGWFLGEIKKGRFEPSHAFALGIKAENAKFVCNFPNPTDENCHRYLRGESLESNIEADKAWVLVCVAGYPLGWAKLVNGRLKNKYPQAWV